MHSARSPTRAVSKIGLSFSAACLVQAYEPTHEFSASTCRKIALIKLQQY